MLVCVHVHVWRAPQVSFLRKLISLKAYLIGLRFISRQLPSKPQGSSSTGITKCFLLHVAFHVHFGVLMLC